MWEPARGWGKGQNRPASGGSCQNQLPANWACQNQLPANSWLDFQESNHGRPETAATQTTPNLVETDAGCVLLQCHVKSDSENAASVCLGSASANKVSKRLSLPPQQIVGKWECAVVGAVNVPPRSRESRHNCCPSPSSCSTTNTTNTSNALYQQHSLTVWPLCCWHCVVYYFCFSETVQVLVQQQQQCSSDPDRDFQAAVCARFA